MPFLVFLFLILIAVVGYFAQLNPDKVTFFIARDTAYSISLTALLLFAVAAGGFLVMITSGVRQTKALYLNWTYRKRQKKEIQVETTYKAGMNAFLAKRHKEAIALFQKVLVLHPNHLNTLLRLGEIHRLEKNFPDAIRLHRMAHLADGENREALLQLAQDLEAAGQAHEAVAALKEIIDQDEAHQAALIRLREIYVRQLQWDEAHAIAEKIIKLPLAPEMRPAEQAILIGIKFEKGMSLLRRHQTEAARRAFKSAVKMDKGFIPGYVGLGQVYIKEGRIESAMTLFEKGYTITQNVILLHQLEELCLERGQPDRILQAYQKGLAKDPASLTLKFYLGKIYDRLEMVDQAFDLISEIGGQIPNLPDLQKILGNLHLRRGEFLLAAEAFRKCLDLQTAVMAPYTCANCHDQTHRWSGRCPRCGQWNSYEPFSIRLDREARDILPPMAASYASSKDLAEPPEGFF